MSNPINDRIKIIIREINEILLVLMAIVLVFYKVSDYFLFAILL